MPKDGQMQKMVSESQKNSGDKFKLTTKQEADVKMVYEEYDDMDKKRRMRYTHLNDRTPFEYLEDSQKRMNAYVPSREDQGKEDWEPNFATRAYANKTKALLATTARTLPEMKYKAVNPQDKFHYLGAQIAKSLVNYSLMNGNPLESMFFSAWSNCTNGTIIEYEGFERSIVPQKRIKSYDLQTGDIEEEIIEEISSGEPVSFEIKLEDLLVKNFFIRDLQDQAGIIWESYYSDVERFLDVFGVYPNAKWVKDGRELYNKDNASTFYNNRWMQSLQGRQGVLVTRYMNKYSDKYVIVANGIPLYSGVMLWRDITTQGMGKKKYPFAKTIYEPFATEFFLGNSLPNSAMGEGDVLNTLYNSALTKQYRSFVPPLLVGQVNRDMLDLEDEVVSGDTKIYVDDINQIKQMDIKGIDGGDIQMIDLITRGLDLTTLDAQQQGVAQRYVTARAAIAADERAKELKSVFFMFMESLWLQKHRLRLPNVLMSYTVPKMQRVIGNEEEGKEDQLNELFQRFNVPDQPLSDGVKGTLAIEFRDRKEIKDNRFEIEKETEQEEAESQANGEPLEKLVVPYGFLDNLKFTLQIIPESLYQSSRAINMAMVIEKIQLIRSAFPEFFAANKAKLIRDLIKAYDDSLDDYEVGENMSFEQEQALQLAQGKAGQGQGNSGANQRVSDLAGTDQNNTSALAEG